MKKLLLLFGFVIPYLIATAQSWNDTLASIEKIFERYKPGSPGAQLAVSRNGEIIFSKAWGMADLEHNSPLTITSLTEAGSVSKQFTAAAILLLEQQGKLSLNDDVRKFIPELPDYGHVITLRSMMQHSSGLRDWGSIAALSGWPRSTKTYNNDDALHIVSLQKALNHKPGDEFLYSNSNYNLLAVVVERVSGLGLDDYSKKYIFEPAGMKHTEWRSNFKKVVPNRAIAYGHADGYYTNMPLENVYGNGGLLTTAEDLLKWTNYYASGKFGSPSLLHRQLQTSTFNNGRTNSYTAGLFIRKYNGIDMIIHDGATASYRANLEYFPSLGLAIAWLSNTSEFDRNPVSVSEDVRDLFIKAEVVTGVSTEATYTVPKSVMDNYTGWYRNQRTGGGVRVIVKNDKLQIAQLGTLNPISERKFAAGSNRLEFSPDRKGFLFINSSKDSIYFTTVDSANLTPARLNEYAGEYYSDEAQVTYLLQVKDGKLVIQQKVKTEFTLTPTYKDGFDLPLGTIYFERDNKNKVAGFKISINRARNVSFVKRK